MARSKKLRASKASLRRYSKSRAVEIVGAGLGDEADLAAGARAVFGRIVAAESTRNSCTFSRLCSRRNREVVSPFRLPGELSIMEEPSTPSKRITFCWLDRPLKRMLSKRAAAVVHGARRQQVKLRNLAAVQRQLGHFARGDVRADARRTQVDGRQFAAGDIHFCSHGGWRKGHIEYTLLADLQADILELRGGHAAALQRLAK